MKRKAFVSTIVLLGLIVLSAGTAEAQYQYEILAHTGNILAGNQLTDIMYTKPQINNLGTVAFWGDTSTASGILTQNGFAVKSGTMIGGFNVTSIDYDCGINDSGIVCFQGAYWNGSTFIPGIFTQNAVIAKQGDTVNGLTLTNFGARTSINNAGTVAYCGYFSGGHGSGQFTQNGVVAKSGDTIGGLTIGNTNDFSDINNSGTIAFLGSPSVTFPPAPTYGWAVFTQNNVIFKAGDIIDGISVHGMNNGPAFNDAGTIVFHGSFSGGDGIFTQNTVVAASGGAIGGIMLSSFGNDPSINNNGTVAFYAKYSGGSGIFTQNGAVAKTGDIIDGLTLSGFDPYQTNNVASINDNGDIAFFTTFSDGSKGIVVAHPVPEPSDFILLGIATFLMLGRGLKKGTLVRYSPISDCFMQ